MNTQLATTPRPLHVVLGTGALARATAEALLARNLEVRFISLSGTMPAQPQGTSIITADLLDIEATSAALVGAHAAYFCAQPPYHLWAEKFDALQAAAIAAARRANSRLIVGENLYAYGPSAIPFTEDMPLRPNTRKGEVRVRMHRALMAEHRTGNLQTAIARAADFFGPHRQTGRHHGQPRCRPRLQLHQRLRPPSLPSALKHVAANRIHQ